MEHNTILNPLFTLSIPSGKTRAINKCTKRKSLYNKNAWADHCVKTVRTHTHLQKYTPGFLDKLQEASCETVLLFGHFGQQPLPSCLFLLLIYDFIREISRGFIAQIFIVQLDAHRKKIINEVLSECTERRCKNLFL